MLMTSQPMLWNQRARPGSKTGALDNHHCARFVRDQLQILAALMITWRISAQ